VKHEGCVWSKDKAEGYTVSLNLARIPNVAKRLSVYRQRIVRSNGLTLAREGDSHDKRSWSPFNAQGNIILKSGPVVRKTKDSSRVVFGAQKGIE
jgi:hypothetical protein